ncbi:hypothetical protein VDG1235_579 [Verrucomicrobiia bacterium DG1235]|nr:hypothetical protein VDG1235_579 [Verrucomicrobiae bacterium DG1235]
MKYVFLLSLFALCKTSFGESIDTKLDSFFDALKANNTELAAHSILHVSNSKLNNKEARLQLEKALGDLLDTHGPFETPS